MRVLEWMAAHLPAPLITLYRALRNPHRPDVQIVEVQATGGSDGRIDFSVSVRNRGTQPTHVSVSASINGHDVHCSPRVVDLLANAAPTRVAVTVPRPELGDLMPECSNETTLYGRELRIEVAELDGKQKRRSVWREHLYDAATEQARYGVQQRYWRIGRGEASESNHRAEAQAEALERDERRREEGSDNPSNYSW